MARRIRKDPQFAADYLRAALEESDEPRVLLLALRHVAQARGIAKIAKAAGADAKVCIVHCLPTAIRASQHSMQLPRQWVSGSPWKRRDG
jgi:hypothetical protein